MTVTPERKENVAFFNIIDTHQGPVAGPDSPVLLRRLKLPNSMKLRHHVALTSGAGVPQGPGKVHG